MQGVTDVLVICATLPFRRKSQLTKHMTEHTGGPAPPEDGSGQTQGGVVSEGVITPRGRGYRQVGLSPVCDICGRNFANMKCLKAHKEASYEICCH